MTVTRRDPERLLELEYELYLGEARKLRDEVKKLGKSLKPRLRRLRKRLDRLENSRVVCKRNRVPDLSDKAYDMKAQIGEVIDEFADEIN